MKTLLIKPFRAFSPDRSRTGNHLHLVLGFVKGSAKFVSVAFTHSRYSSGHPNIRVPPKSAVGGYMSGKCYLRDFRKYRFPRHPESFPLDKDVVSMALSVVEKTGKPLD